MKKLGIGISGFFLISAAAHTFLASVEIDAIAIVLLALASLPWIFPYLKSLELPGGVKIELKDILSATDKIKEGLGAEDFAATKNEQKGEYDYLDAVAEHDPNLALVAVRIEIEKYLRKAFGQTARPIPLSRMVHELTKSGRLSSNIAGGLLELVQIGNHAAHGVEVSPGAADWVLSEAPALLARLRDDLQRNAQPDGADNEDSAALHPHV